MAFATNMRRPDPSLRLDTESGGEAKFADGPPGNQRAI